MARRRERTPEDAALIKSLSKIQGTLTSKLANLPKYSWDKFGYHRKSGEKQPCSWVINKKKPKPFPVGRVELEVVTNDKAERLGLPVGPAIRLCYGKDQPSPLVSVKDPVKALKIAKDFRDCAVKGDDKEKCAIEALNAGSAKNLTIAGLRRRKNRKARR